MTFSLTCFFYPNSQEELTCYRQHFCPFSSFPPCCNYMKF